jgi:hypothetical protein
MDQPLLNTLHSHLIAYPTPSNLNISWNWGSLAGICLVLQIITGVCLAMHYTAHVDLAFASVQHIMRDVPSGWLLRYFHANGASFFFIVVYIHLFRGLYYNSYAQPRERVWLLGVIILLMMILTAFIGYVLPWGQLGPKYFCVWSHDLYFFAQCFAWSNVFHDSSLWVELTAQFMSKTCMQDFASTLVQIVLPSHNLELLFFVPKVSTLKRIGPHSQEVICGLFGLMLGDAYAEKHGLGTRFTFHHSHQQLGFLQWIQDFLSIRGYMNDHPLIIKQRKAYKNKVYQTVKAHTYTFQSLDWIREAFYVNGHKKVPYNIDKYLSPLALALWICCDGHYCKPAGGLIRSTQSFSLECVQLLSKVRVQKYRLKTSVRQNEATKEQYIIYIWAESMPIVRSLTKHYMPSCMHYKLAMQSVTL